MKRGHAVGDPLKHGVQKIADYRGKFVVEKEGLWLALSHCPQFRHSPATLAACRNLATTTPY